MAQGNANSNSNSSIGEDEVEELLGRVSEGLRQNMFWAKDVPNYIFFKGHPISF